MPYPFIHLVKLTTLNLWSSCFSFPIAGGGVVSVLYQCLLEISKLPHVIGGVPDAPIPHASPHQQVVKSRQKEFQSYIQHL